MRRARLLVAIAGLVLLAGCIGGADELDEASVDDPDTSADVPELVGHRAGEFVELPEEARELTARIIDTGYDGAEPTIGVTSDGTIFTNPFTDDESLIRSTDHGQTWEPVGDDVANPKVKLDPWMHVDEDTDRVFNGPLYVACSWLSWSDDLGESWTFNPIAGCGLPAHDHQKITTGPPAEGVDTMGYPNVVYYAYNGAFRGNPVSGTLGSQQADTLDGTWVHTSFDGGQTFLDAARVFDPSPCKSGINGPVETGPEGTAYLAHLTCDGVQIATSQDSGASWETTAHLTEQGTYPGLIPDPYVDADEAGNAYVATPGEDGLLYVAASEDEGQTWSELAPVTPPDVTFTTLPVMRAGEDGHVAFAYLATTNDTSDWEEPDPSYASDDTVWHLYYTRTGDALTEQPRFTTARLTPDGDPVQRGCIWLWGAGNPCRNLLDFIDMVEHEGRPYITYTDGCDACQSADESRQSLHRVAILEQGPALDGALLDPLVDLDEVPETSTVRTIG